MSGAGKGDTYRKVNVEKFNSQYESIFGKKEELDFQKGHTYSKSSKGSQSKK